MTWEQPTLPGMEETMTGSEAATYYTQLQRERGDVAVDHPAHYGGADDPYEAIKVIEAWKLGFGLGNCVKYIARAGKKGSLLTDLRKARWYLDRVIHRLENRHPDDDEEFVRG